MKKIRYLGNPPTNWNARMGPAIGSCNDIYFLKDEPWLEIRPTSIKQCKDDGVIPWVRTGCRGEMQQALDLGIEFVLGPNAVFGNSNDPLANRFELSYPNMYRLLMSDEVNGDLARKYVKEFGAYDVSKVQQVPYFMRPELYDEPFFYEYKWDAYYHIKTDINKFTRDMFKSITATHHGWYNFFELKYKAQHSAVCLHGCHYDNYGLAVHEISILGCPLVYDKHGMKRGAVGEGMGVEVDDIASCTPENTKKIMSACKQAMEMDRKKVWEASMEYQSIENCKKRYRKALGFE